MLRMLMTQLALGLALIGPLLLTARLIKRKHYWTADTLQEMAGESSYATILGMGLSYFFAFDGDIATAHSAYACTLFATFLYPFFISTWIADWKSGNHHGTTAFGVLISFCTSMTMLGGAVYYATLDKGVAEAVATGSTTSVVTTVICCVVAAFAGVSLHKSVI